MSRYGHTSSRLEKEFHGHVIYMLETQVPFPAPHGPMSMTTCSPETTRAKAYLLPLAKPAFIRIHRTGKFETLASGKERKHVSSTQSIPVYQADLKSRRWDPVVPVKKRSGLPVIHFQAPLKIQRE